MNDNLHAALRTALWTFLALFSVTVLAWLQQVAEWSSKSGHAALPGLSVLGYGLVSAFVAAIAGLINFVVAFGQSRGWLPGTAARFAKRAR